MHECDQRWQALAKDSDDISTRDVPRYQRLAERAVVTEISSGRCTHSSLSPLDLATSAFSAVGSLLLVQGRCYSYGRSADPGLQAPRQLAADPLAAAPPPALCELWPATPNRLLLEAHFFSVVEVPHQG